MMAAPTVHTLAKNWSLIDTEVSNFAAKISLLP